MVTANQKSTIDTQKKRKYNPNNTKDSHQIKREKNKRGREEKKPTKQILNNEQNDKKNIHIDNYLKQF